MQPQQRIDHIKQHFSQQRNRSYKKYTSRKETFYNLYVSDEEWENL